MNPRKIRGSFFAALFLSIIAFALSACSGNSGDASSPPDKGVDVRYTHLSVEEAREMIEAGVPGEDYILLDTRELNVYKHDHIPGAVCVPETIISALDNSDEIPELPDKDALIIVYCQFGGVSKVACEKLCDMRYSNLYEFDGMDYWKGDIEYGDDF